MPVDLTLRRPDGVDLDIRAPAGQTLGAALDGLGLGVDHQECWSGSRRLTGADRIGGPGLRSGDVVSTGQAGSRIGGRESMLQLQVVGGPGAGAAVSLSTGLHIIGRATDAHIFLLDPDVSRRHATLTVSANGVTVHDLGSSNGTSIDGTHVPPVGAPLLSGQALRCGDCVLSLAALPDPPAAGRFQAEGLRTITRPPRVRPASASAVELPDHPHARVPMRMQWAAAGVGAIAGCVLALLLHSPLFLAFAALGPLSLLATAAVDRRSTRKGRRTDARTFSRDEHAAQAQLRGALVVELAQLRRRYPDPAQIRLIAATPSCRIWERRAGDDDALVVRVGLGAQASAIPVRRAGAAEAAPAEHALAPIAVDLRAGPLGIASRSAAGLGLARSIVAQLCVLHAPGDLAIVGLIADSRAERWRWIRWIPHLRTVAVDPAGRAAAIADALAELDQRETSRGPGRPWRGQWIVLLIDGPAAVAAMAGLSRLLRDGPAVGISAVCLDEETRLLPSSCTTLVQAGPGPGPWGRLTREGADAVSDDSRQILLDGLALPHCDDLARSLAQLEDPADGAPTVPGHVRLLDLLALGQPTADGVRKRWARTSGLRTPIGSGAHGPVEVDLERDGPHMLIAGTTGAGKSELLQSIVAGLAAARPPEDLAFVLIDYKGGAAFGACAGLPHVAGLVTDLDAHLTERALRSLGAELRRRETALARVGAKDMAGYRLGAPTGADRLPYLVIVIDEFAALALELPQFVSGLVGVAARGRSLGVHLILATQRPSGVVSPEIRANTALRIALRVTDAGESIDVIGIPDAASISSSTPGRAYLKGLAGAGDAIALQAARASGRSPSAGDSGSQVLDGWRRTRAPRETGTSTDDLAALVAAVAHAADPLERPGAPWLPPLPASLPITDSRLSVAQHRPHDLPIGLRDCPDEQTQDVFALDLSAGGSILIAGSARSGRTTALRTVVAGALGQAPGALDLYVVDCSGGGLGDVVAAPNCAAALTADDPAALAAMVRILSDRIRHDAGGLTARPALVVIDGVEAMAAALDDADPGRGDDALLALLRQAGSGRTTIVVTGDRPALVGRIGSAVSRKLLLRMNDRADYLLAGIAMRRVPDTVGPGRALHAPDGLEIQFAVLGLGDEPGQKVELARIARAAAAAGPPIAAGARTASGARAASGDRPTGRPMRIRALPRSVRLIDIEAVAQGVEPGRGALLGLGGDDARPIWAPLFAPGARVLVAGPPGSGRTTTLTLIAVQARGRGLTVIHVHGHRSPPPALPAGINPGAVIVVDDCDALTDTPLGDQLARLAQDRGAQSAIIVATTPDAAMSYRGIGAAVARRRTGILLSPGPGDGAALGLALPRGRAPGNPGRGVLVGLGPTTIIQVAMP